MSKLNYYIIDAADAHRLGVTAYREGNTKEGYLVHEGDFAANTSYIKQRALPVTEKEAVEFVKSLKK